MSTNRASPTRFSSFFTRLMARRSVSWTTITPARSENDASHSAMPSRFIADSAPQMRTILGLAVMQPLRFLARFAPSLESPGTEGRRSNVHVLFRRRRILQRRSKFELLKTDSPAGKNDVDVIPVEDSINRPSHDSVAGAGRGRPAHVPLNPVPAVVRDRGA